MNNEPLKGHLDLLLLAIVADKPLHGYAVIEKLRAQTDGLFDLPEGTIYPALHRLEEQGLLKSRWMAVKPRRRRVYEITVKGEGALAKRRAEWKLFSKAINTAVGA